MIKLVTILLLFAVNCERWLFIFRITSIDLLKDSEEINFTFSTIKRNKIKRVVVFNKKFPKLPIIVRSFLIFEKDDVYNYQIAKFNKGINLHFKVTSGLKESYGIVETKKDDNKNAYIYNGLGWSVYVLKCTAAPVPSLKSNLSDDERKCLALAVLQPNLHSVLIWARFEIKLLTDSTKRDTYDNKNWTSAKQIHCGNEYIDGQPEHIVQLTLKQPFLITSFLIGKTSHVAFKKQPFLLPLIIDKAGTLVINEVCINFLINNDTAVFDLKPITNDFDRLKCDTKLYEGNEPPGDHLLILDVISYSKDSKDGTLLYHDMCMDTDVRRNCATWYTASPIYITGNYAHRFSYNITNLDIKSHYFLRIYLNVLMETTFRQLADLTIDRRYFLDYDILKNGVLSPFVTSHGSNNLMVIPKWNHSLHEPVPDKNETITINIRTMQPLPVPFKICVLDESQGVYEFEDMEISSDKMSYNIIKEIKVLSSVKILLRTTRTYALDLSENDINVTRVINDITMENGEIFTYISCAVRVHLGKSFLYNLNGDLDLDLNIEKEKSKDISSSNDNNEEEPDSDVYFKTLKCREIREKIFFFKITLTPVLFTVALFTISNLIYFKLREMRINRFFGDI